LKKKKIKLNIYNSQLFFAQKKNLQLFSAFDKNIPVKNGF